MTKELFVAKAAELKDGEKKVVVDGRTEIGVYRVDGQLYAYHNYCSHQGGPACEGLLMAQVEEVIAEDKTYQGMRFNHDDMHIVCPWHGWEYHVKDGRAVAAKGHRLRKAEIVERDGEIYV
ncbi:MAG: Rieske (2Fe-2S) protein, partial [Alphaproteobacteria bacterium]